MSDQNSSPSGACASGRPMYLVRPPKSRQKRVTESNEVQRPVTPPPRRDWGAGDPFTGVAMNAVRPNADDAFQVPSRFGEVRKVCINGVWHEVHDGSA